MNRNLMLIAIFTLLLSVSGATLRIPSVKAATTRSFYLTANYISGWNNTSPGPTITVEQNDTVHMTLTSIDGLTHRFFVSYHNSSLPQLGDPQSSDFSGTIPYQFNASNTVATYTYYCYYHSGVMFGVFKVVLAGTIPEFQPMMILPLFMVVTLLAVVIVNKRRRSNNASKTKNIALAPSFCMNASS